jgi:hypothetical protein
MEIISAGLDLTVVNNSIALFNCEKKVSGVIHSARTGETTVILDGGYVLGKFDCPHCAIAAVGLLVVNIRDAEKTGCGNYRHHKRLWMEQAIEAVH